MKKVLVCGAAGFIGTHLVSYLKKNNFWVRGVDCKLPEFSNSDADEFLIGDLREKSFCNDVIDLRFDYIFQLAADMGGAGFIFTGENDADLMANSALINLHVLEQAKVHGVGKLFYSSSACIYPEYNQLDPENPHCAESSAYPAAPDSEYGWEKLFSERLYLAYQKNYGLAVRIARFHNVFGELGTWQGGREKAPAAICRKVALARDGDSIEIWGDGLQTRSFLYISECLEGIMRLVESDFSEPINVGSDEMISINDLAKIMIAISGKNISIRNIDGPVGVRGRNSDNRLIQKELGWKPSQSLKIGIEKTYRWIDEQIKNDSIH